MHEIEVCPSCGALPCDQVDKPDSDTIAALRAEVERLREALTNIKALAMKRQHEGGADGNLADIEGFARAALKGQPRPMTKDASNGSSDRPYSID